MTSSLILSTVTFIYGLAGFFYIFAWVFRKPAAGRIGTGAAFPHLSDYPLSFPEMSQYVTPRARTTAAVASTCS